MRLLIKHNNIEQEFLPLLSITCMNYKKEQKSRRKVCSSAWVQSSNSEKIIVENCFELFEVHYLLDS